MQIDDVALQAAGEDGKIRLFELLARQAERYTMGESTSLRQETAGALLESVWLSLSVLSEEAGIPMAELLRKAPDELLYRAEQAVRRRVSRVRLAYQRAGRCRFQEDSIALTDTLRSVGAGLRIYDSRFFAAEVPCDIDYQLAHPVDEHLRGILYLQDYLRRLTVEDAFLRRFAPEAVRRVLAAAVPSHRELLVNLYEPVACAALGITITEGSLFSLDVTAGGQEALAGRLTALRPAQRRALIEAAAQTLARRLELGAEGTDYLYQTALAMLPRVEAVLAHEQGWQPLFPVLG